MPGLGDFGGGCEEVFGVGVGEVQLTNVGGGHDVFWPWMRLFVSARRLGCKVMNKLPKCYGIVALLVINA